MEISICKFTSDQFMFILLYNNEWMVKSLTRHKHEKMQFLLLIIIYFLVKLLKIKKKKEL